MVDHKQKIFKITERVMRAVLVSAMKMSTFHAAQRTIRVASAG